MAKRRKKKQQAAANTLTDVWGETHARPAPEILSTRAIPDRLQDRAQLDSILRHMKPSKLLDIFNQAEAGYIGPQIGLARDLIERFGHLRSVMQTRTLRVTGTTFMVKPGDEEEASQEAADLFEEAWDDLGGRALIGRMMDAVLQQWTVDQILWDTHATHDGKPYWQPIGCEQTDARRLTWPMVEGDVPMAAPRLMLDWNPAHTIPLLPGQFIVHGSSYERGRPGKMARVRAVASVWLIGQLALVDFATLSEQWGRPFISVLYAAGTSEEELEAILAKIAKSMADRVIAVPTGASVQTSEASSTTSNPIQLQLITLINDITSKVIVGNTTQSDAAGNNDSVSSPTHAKVGEEIRNADALDIADTINLCLVRPWFTFNRHLFGPDARCPYLSPVLEDAPTPEEFGQRLTIASSLRLKVNSQQVYDGLALERPEGVEDVIELGAGAAAGGFGLPGFGGLMNDPRTPLKARETEAPADDDQEKAPGQEEETPTDDADEEDEMQG